MDRNPGCGAAGRTHATAWPDGWFSGWAPEQRPARAGSPRPPVEAIVRHRQIRVTPVRGWREHRSEPGGSGRDGGLAGRPEPAPCEACEQSEAAVRIRAALDTLPGRYRQALHLVYVEGRTHGEVAIHLVVPLGTAKAWVRRGLRALRAAHVSLDATPTPEVAAASRLLTGLCLRSRRGACVTQEVAVTTV
jgi:hypothetical protein